MFNASQQLQQIRNRLNGTSVGDETLRPTQQVLLQAQQALLNAQIEQQRKSLEGNTILQDTLQKQRDYVTAGATGWSISYSCCRGREQQTADPDRETARGGYPDETARIQANPLVKQELDINHQLSEKLIRATENGNQLVRRNIGSKTGSTARCSLNGILKSKFQFCGEPAAVAYSLPTATDITVGG